VIVGRGSATLGRCSTWRAQPSKQRGAHPNADDAQQTGHPSGGSPQGRDRRQDCADAGVYPGLSNRRQPVFFFSFFKNLRLLTPLVTEAGISRDGDASGRGAAAGPGSKATASGMPAAGGLAAELIGVVRSVSSSASGRRAPGYLAVAEGQGRPPRLAALVSRRVSRQARRSTGFRGHVDLRGSVRTIRVNHTALGRRRRGDFHPGREPRDRIAGVVVWAVGVSMGFPPVCPRRRRADRPGRTVSVVASIGYFAKPRRGPPAIGLCSTKYRDRPVSYTSLFGSEVVAMSSPPSPRPAHAARHGPSLNRRRPRH